MIFAELWRTMADFEVPDELWEHNPTFPRVA
jgi:hypothetical protein